MVSIHLILNCRSEEVADFDSFMECERLSRFGRFSFNKFNKEVEVGFKVVRHRYESDGGVPYTCTYSIVHSEPCILLYVILDVQFVVAHTSNRPLYCSQFLPTINKQPYMYTLVTMLFGSISPAAVKFHTH